MLTIRAHAKLNLTLEVLARRPDGYYEIASLMQAISLADTLTFEPASELTFTCSDPRLETPDNLVLRAARLLDPKGRRGATIRLDKAIPVAAGLGGGSADAAAALWGLSRLWDLDLPSEEMASLGSDVPFFLHGGTALARGRGDQIEQLPAAKQRWFLVLHPYLDLPDKTKTMYGRLEPRHRTSGTVTQQLASRIKAGRPVREAYLYNAFDAVAFDLLPALHDWRRRLLAEVPARPHLAGSGPTLFIPVDDEAHGDRVAAALRSHAEGPDGADVFVVQSVNTCLEVL